MSEFVGYIYLITDFKENKIYIGSKVGTPSRTATYYGTGKIISRILKKRGKYFLHKRIIGIINTSYEDLLKAEDECIAFYDVTNPIYGYNIVKESKGVLGYKHTEESKQKMSEALKGKTPWNKGKKLGPISKETKTKISKSMTGIKRSKEHQEKLTASQTGDKSYWYGKKLPKETKRKMSEARKGRIVSKETRNKISEANKGENNGMHKKCILKQTNLSEKVND